MVVICHEEIRRANTEIRTYPMVEKRLERASEQNSRRKSDGCVSSVSTEETALHSENEDSARLSELVSPSDFLLVQGGGRAAPAPLSFIVLPSLTSSKKRKLAKHRKLKHR